MIVPIFRSKRKISSIPEEVVLSGEDDEGDDGKGDKSEGLL